MGHPASREQAYTAGLFAASYASQIALGCWFVTRSNREDTLNKVSPSLTLDLYIGVTRCTFYSCLGKCLSL